MLVKMLLYLVLNLYYCVWSLTSTAICIFSTLVSKTAHLYNVETGKVFMMMLYTKQ